MIRRQWLQAPGLALLVCTLGACGETEQPVAPPVANPFEAARVGANSTLEVMTWNIENFPKDSTTVGWVTRIIEGLQPDIVAVEEIANGASFSALIAQLDGWGGVQANSDNYINLGFLFREGGGLAISASYEIMATEKQTLMRIPYVLEASWNGIPIVVIAVHLKAQESGTADDVKRRDSCLLLAGYVAAHYPGQCVFIVGDWNDQITDAAPDNVFQNFLDGPESWRFADMAIALGPGSGYSYPSYNPPSHLDHILVTDEVFPALEGPVAATTVVPLHAYIPGGWSQYNNEVSDHLPVVLRLQP